MAKAHMDFGHGGKDPGATKDDIKEKDIVLPVGLKVGNILERHNVEVSYSRIDDRFIELSERSRMANKNDVDVFVSLHCNSFTDDKAQGLETFSHPNSKNGTALAKCIQDSLLKDKLYTKNRGLKTANFQVLRETKMTATLVELGFISNKEDLEILINKQDELAESVAKGILNFLGIKYIEKVEEITENNKGTELELIKILLHGKEIEIEGMKDSKTNYIPVRFLEQLGYEVSWDEETRVVTVDYREVK